MSLSLCVFCGCRAGVEQSAATDQGRLLNTDIPTRDYISPIFSVSHWLTEIWHRFLLTDGRPSLRQESCNIFIGRLCKVPPQRLWWRHLNLDICSSSSSSSMHVFKVWASSSSPRLNCAKFHVFAASIADLAHKKIVYSVNQSITQLIWCPENRSMCCEKIDAAFSKPHHLAKFADSNSVTSECQGWHRSKNQNIWMITKNVGYVFSCLWPKYCWLYDIPRGHNGFFQLVILCMNFTNMSKFLPFLWTVSKYMHTWQPWHYYMPVPETKVL